MNGLWKILLGLGIVGGVALALSGKTKDGGKDSYPPEHLELIEELRALIIAERDGTMPLEEISARAAEIGDRLTELGWTFEEKVELIRELYKEAGIPSPIGGAVVL